MVSQYLRPIAILAMLNACGQMALAQAQGQALREMHHVMWTADDGAPQAISELAQHPDGTLWIGSESGLFNFDGQTFRPFKSPPGEPEVPASEVYSLLITSDGTLWASFYREGIARISAGRVTVFRQVEAEPLIAPQQLRAAPDGRIWAIDSGQLIFFLSADSTWRRERTPTSGPIGGVFVDSANTLWLVQDRVLFRRPLAQSSYTQTEVHADVVTGVAETRSGDIWINDYDAATSLGRTQRVSRAGDIIGVLPQSLFTSGSVVSTKDDSLIVASFAAGLRRFSPAETAFRTDQGSNIDPEPDVFGGEDGLSSDATRAVIVDSHGSIWIGGARGLDRLRPALLTRYLPAVERSNWAVCGSTQGDVWVANVLGEVYSASRPTPITWPGIGDPLFSLTCGDADNVWITNSRGVWAVTADSITALPPIVGAPEQAQIRVVAASDHTLYATDAGVSEDGSIWQYKGDQWIKLPRQGELGSGGYATYMDRSDRLWIGHAGGQVALHTEDGAQILDSGEPGLGFVYAFLDTARGMFAAGTNGLAVLRDSRFEMLTFAEPSSAHGVRGLVEAFNGDVWLNAASGLTQVSVTELEAGLARPAYPMKSRSIREGDYAGATQRPLNYLETAAHDSQGRLWFVTRNGVVHLDPERSVAVGGPPIVTIRSMVADGQPVADNRVLPPGTRTLAMHYFGVNMTAPESVIYRYRLEGFDESWQEAGRRTEAFYTRLAPGTYTFSVMASSGDGTWTAPVSSLFTVLPSFYQTPWFAATMAGLAVFIAWLIHKARVRQLARVMEARFDERLAERTRVARELHDTLLQTVHGSKLVADRALRDTNDHNKLVRALEQLSAWLTEASAEGRAALQSLRTSTTERNDLAAAFQRAIDECRSDSGAELLLTVHGSARDMHPMVRDEVYRIGYEAIRNACVHSRASRIEVALAYSQDLRLRISDNGVGIDAGVIAGGREGHFGLRGMRERAERIGAKLTLESGAMPGTNITLTVPGAIVFSSA